MTETNSQEFYNQTQLNQLLEEVGIPTQDQLMGLALSTESAGLDEEMLEEAHRHWLEYYESNNTNFGWVLCHLISKADIYNLHKISKGFPEYVRIFVENQLLAKVDETKKAEVLGE